MKMLLSSVAVAVTILAFSCFRGIGEDQPPRGQVNFGGGRERNARALTFLQEEANLRRIEIATLRVRVAQLAGQLTSEDGLLHGMAGQTLRTSPSSEWLKRLEESELNRAMLQAKLRVMEESQDEGQLRSAIDDLKSQIKVAETFEALLSEKITAYRQSQQGAGERYVELEFATKDLDRAENMHDQLQARIKQLQIETRVDEPRPEASDLRANRKLELRLEIRDLSQALEAEQRLLERAQTMGRPQGLASYMARHQRSVEELKRELEKKRVELMEETRATLQEDDGLGRDIEAIKGQIKAAEALEAILSEMITTYRQSQQGVGERYVELEFATKYLERAENVYDQLQARIKQLQTETRMDGPPAQ